MNKRLRKKKYLNEFSCYGLSVNVQRNTDKAFDDFNDDFVYGLIEGLNCQFGGGGSNDDFSGFVQLGNKKVALGNLESIKQWLSERNDLQSYVLGEIIDAHYGPFDF